MFINSLDIYQFRNVEQSAITLSPELNFIVGRNGQGKTNLVEAIHILSTGKSFRAASIKQVIGWNFSEAAIACSLIESASDIDLRIILRSQGREYLVNDNKVSALTGFIGHLMTVCFSPDDLQIVQGGPGERRKCIDKHIVDANPGALKHFIAYQKALKNKNSLLKSGGATLQLISPWNQILAKESRQISKLRKTFLETLEKAVNEIHQHFGASDGKVTFVLQSVGVQANEEIASEEELFEKLNNNFQRERYLKVSDLGVHRDDIKIFLGGKDSRLYASQGQARSIVLSLKLGVITLLEELRQESPVVLLDDVDSELDQKRSDAFFDLLLRQGRQVVITGTEFGNDRLKNNSTSKVFNVIAGHFSSADSRHLIAL